MNTSKQYFSIVTNRIQILKTKLTNPSISALEKEFIKKKIEYLQKIADLPLLIAITNMSKSDLQELQERYGYSKENTQAFLIKIFGLEQLEHFIHQPKIMTLEYLKEVIIQDFEGMNALLKLQSQNFEYERKKQALYGIGFSDSVSYTQLSFDETQLSFHEEKVESAISRASQDYNFETLKELHSYKINRQKPLSFEFLLKHKEKVSSDLKMQKLANRLTRKGIFGAIDKILPFRKKREQAFLEAVLNSYKRNDALSTLGIKDQDITTMNEYQVKSLIKRIKKQTTYHRNKILQAKNKIKTAKSQILKQVKEYESLQEQDKKRFMEILSTKTNFLPRMFQNQIWNEPNLKDSLMLLACYKEEKELMEQISSPIQNKAEILIQLSNQKPKTLVKNAA
ncbi:MAG: hypothetical protein HFH08_05920 [Bacilli bacterium]|nr:hypothetical protein [Bacilli bacterium]